MVDFLELFSHQLCPTARCDLGLCVGVCVGGGGSLMNQPPFIGGEIVWALSLHFRYILLHTLEFQQLNIDLFLSGYIIIGPSKELHAT